MKPLYTEEEYNKAKTFDRLPIECYHCGETFYKDKKAIYRVKIKYKRETGKYCSKKCEAYDHMTGKNLPCKQCNQTFYKVLSQMKKSNNIFVLETVRGLIITLIKLQGLEEVNLKFG